MLMFVIRYLLPSNDHQIKKLLLIFWEIVPKRGPDEKLLHEMILVCDAYRKDLQHPNEFIRGSTLRYVNTVKLCTNTQKPVKIDNIINIYIVANPFYA